MSSGQESGADPRATLEVILAFGVVAVLALLLIEAPVLAWGALRGELTPLDPADVLGAGIRLAFSANSTAENISLTEALGAAPGVLPPLWVAVVIDTMLVSGLVLLLFGGWLRVDRWRGRSQHGAASWSPRAKVRARAWATPRDMLHCQPREGSRSGPVRRAVTPLLRIAAGERRAAEPAGGDNWLLGFLRGVELRSAGEHHGGLFGSTGAGKNVLVLTNAIREAMGSVIVVANKMEVITSTIAARMAVGPVWIYAPLSDPEQVRSCSWSPLTTCLTWDGALRMAQWIHDADPHASKSSQGSDGARFYNTETVQSLLPSLLHAAALGGRQMVDVLGWLRGGTDALDEPREILTDHHALHAAVAIENLQSASNDDRTRGLLLASASQLVGAYRFPQMQEFDRPGFDINELLDRNGTLYVVAPESQQELLAPITGGLLGEAFRACEERANAAPDPRALPVLKIVVDEAAHLAPLSNLPAHLAVSRGWQVRMLLAYQSCGQVRSRYGDQADEVLANLGSMWFLGPIRDRATRDELMGLLGSEDVTQTSRTHDSWGARRSTTEHDQERHKIGAADLAKLGRGEAIVIHGSDLPARVRLRPWWKLAGARTSEEAHRREFERQRQERERRSR